MSEIPAELHYTKSHEWVRREDDGLVTIGITDHAQGLLGDLVFVELPEAGAVFAAAEACCVVESVKAASDVFMPVSGEVTQVNEVLVESPELINDSPFDDGWLLKIKPSAEQEIEELLDSNAYQEEIDD